MSATADAVARVTAAIDGSASELLGFLGEYVRFQSVNPGMLSEGQALELRQCQQWLAEELGRWDVFDEIDVLASDLEQPNVAARRRGRGGGPSLLFNGHSDVVPVTDEQAAAWSGGSPWSGTVEGGYLWGRGASDMKGGNAAFLWGIKCLAAADVVLRGDLIATVVSGEETGSHEIGVDLLSPAGYEAGFAIIAEPTALSICPASVGEFYFQIRIEGRSAHLASRHLSIYPGAYGEQVPGVNAIDKMWKVQRALSDLEREWGLWQRHPLMSPGIMSINFSRIHAGETYSAMAESCELTGSVLFNPALSFEAVKQEFSDAISSVSRSDYWLREHPPVVTIPIVLDHKEPINLPTDHPGCNALMRAYRTTFGSEPVLGCTTGTNDGAYLFARGQPLLTCGPGSSDDGAHGVDEHVDVEAVVRAAKLYATAAIEWCGVAEP